MNKYQGLIHHNTLDMLIVNLIMNLKIHISIINHTFFFIYLRKFFINIHLLYFYIIDIVHFF
jgi:hypothetical protein